MNGHFNGFATRSIHSGISAKSLFVSCGTDWLFPTEQSREMVRALLSKGKDVSLVEVDSPYGHDAFLIVGFPNFGHWRMRTGLFFGGRAPKAPALPFEWYDTPNIWAANHWRLPPLLPPGRDCDCQGKRSGGSAMAKRPAVHSVDQSLCLGRPVCDYTVTV
ncbi:MAG: hypothetical protein JEZ11_22985 [Desulfobacterales bacterium]|nr:hypothetical protein [Desulfobacterales bacterium]